MNTRTILLSSFLFFIIFSSCKKEDAPAVEKVPSKNEEINELTKFISATTGVAIAQITYNKEKEEFDIYDDLKMTLEDAKSHYKNNLDLVPNSPYGRVQQRRDTYLANLQGSFGGIVPILVYFYVNDPVPTDWANAVQSAISNWNSISNTKLRFDFMALGSNIFPINYAIGIRMYTETSSTIAYTYTPNSIGMVPNAVYINTYHNSLSQAMKIFAITHELGHAVGLLHTDMTTGSLIPGTPVNDPSSVMNSTVLPWTAFTPFDILAIQTLYP